MTTFKIFMNIFPLFFIAVVFNANTSADVDCNVLHEYEEMYGPLKAKHDANVVWDNLMIKFPEARASQYVECFIKAKEKFASHEDKTSGYINGNDELQFFEIRNTESENDFFSIFYGDQKLYSKMIFFGILLVESCLEIKETTTNAYDFILFTSSFHRQMMAQYMNPYSDKNHHINNQSFGYIHVDTKTKEITPTRLRTQMCFQFPEACKLINDKIKNNHNQFTTNKTPPIFSEEITISRESFYIKRIFFKNHGKSWPLSILLTPKHEEKTKLFSDEDYKWLRIPSSIDNDNAFKYVIVQHGNNMVSKSMYKELNDISIYLFELLSYAESKENKIEIIAKIAFLESHLTFIIQGGGSLVEMLTEGLLRFKKLPSYLYQKEDQKPRMPLWSKTMCFPDSEMFVDEMKKVLLNISGGNQ